ncbi:MULTISPECIES: DUF416 family protein [unclassified Bradyrhizobium]|uniref:DUF416 family protein n=1 Tax=unclassified Bradyrhizobium TaxID=2631580 RepID=UPI0028F0CD00|nr:MULTISPECIES: DUF416 family protein [unclassified Bradyrhizobium]
MGRKLRSLKAQARVALALLTCERMIPALMRFSADTGMDASIFRNGLDQAWLGLDDRRPVTELSKLIAMMQSRVPDTENYDHELTSFALNASVAVIEAAELIIDKRLEHLLEVSNLAQETAAFVAQEEAAKRGILLSLVDIYAHPSMRSELSRQIADAEFLQKLTDIPAKEELLSVRRGLG